MSDGLNDMAALIKAAYEPYIKQALSAEPLFRPDPEWKAQQQAKRERHAAENLERWQWVADRVDGMEVLPTLVRLHKPQGADRDWQEGYCDDCFYMVSGHEYDMEPWPCSTFVEIEKWVKNRGW